MKNVFDTSSQSVTVVQLLFTLPCFQLEYISLRRVRVIIFLPYLQASLLSSVGSVLDRDWLCMDSVLEYLG